MSVSELVLLVSGVGGLILIIVLCIDDIRLRRRVKRIKHPEKTVVYIVRPLSPAARERSENGKERRH